MVAVLGDELSFPSPESAAADGLVALGGDLTTERLLLAYRSGIFPWPIFSDDLMTWFSPDPRAILELDRFYVSRSLAKRRRQGQLEVRVNTAFVDVLRGCAARTTDRPATWITRRLGEAYVELHRRGHAHSVETWEQGRLVGGLYGIAIGGFFAGESMFSRRPDASKLALWFLVEHLRDRGFELLDIQQATPHLVSLGAHEVPRSVYLKRLDQALARPVRFL